MTYAQVMKSQLHFGLTPEEYKEVDCAGMLTTRYFDKSPRRFQDEENEGSLEIVNVDLGIEDASIDSQQ